MVEAYPLQWPAGWPRARNKRPSPFKTTFAVARDTLMDEIRRMGGRQVVLSTNIPIRKDGLPYAGFAQPKDAGVAVYFTRGTPGQQLVLACDLYTKLEDNIQALRKTVEAMRGIARWGASDLLDRAFTGFTALPPPAAAAAPGGVPWWEILEVSPTAPSEVVRGSYRRLAALNHPDKGGSPARMAQINAAFEAAEKELS